MECRRRELDIDLATIRSLLVWRDGLKFVSEVGRTKKEDDLRLHKVKSSQENVVNNRVRQGEPPVIDPYVNPGKEMRSHRRYLGLSCKMGKFGTSINTDVLLPIRRRREKNPHQKLNKPDAVAIANAIGKYLVNPGEFVVASNVTKAMKCHGMEPRISAVLPEQIILVKVRWNNRRFMIFRHRNMMSPKEMDQFVQGWLERVTLNVSNFADCFGFTYKDLKEYLESRDDLTLEYDGERGFLKTARLRPKVWPWYSDYSTYISGI